MAEPIINLHTIIELLQGEEMANDGGNMSDYLNLKGFLERQMEFTKTTPEQMLKFYQTFDDEGCLEEVHEALAGYLYL